MIQVVKKKCCGAIFAACLEPHCYTDKEWLKELKKYVNRGDKVEVIKKEDFKFGGCECDKIKKQEDLFGNVY